MRPSALGAAPSHARNARCMGSSAKIQSPRATRMRPRQSASPAASHLAVSLGTLAPRTSRTSLHATDCCCSRPPRRVRTSMPAGPTLTMSPSMEGALPRSSMTSARSGALPTPMAIVTATVGASVRHPLNAMPKRSHRVLTAGCLRCHPSAALAGIHHRPPVLFVAIADCPTHRRRRSR